MYYSLSEALQHVDNTNAVYAIDSKRKNGTIGKIFVVKTPFQVEEALQTYGWHCYEILLPDRPTKVFVDIETVHGDYNTVKEGALTFIKMLKMWKDGNYILLDSSDNTKCSFHIIGGPFLKNPFHVGALVRRITCYIYAARNTEELMQNFNIESLFDKEGKYIVDECIYTNNRQFRLAQMCKMGSTRVLTGCKWYESILQSINAETVECLEIDNSEPSSTSLKTFDLFAQHEGKYVKKVQNLSCLVYTELPKSLYAVVDHIPEVKQVKFDVRTGSYTLYSYSKCCNIANRIHKSNHTWYILNPWSRYVYQKCFDDECRGKYHELEIPNEKWATWAKYSQQSIDVSTVTE